jgi:hypothetical protein
MALGMLGKPRHHDNKNISPSLNAQYPRAKAKSQAERRLANVLPREATEVRPTIFTFHGLSDCPFDVNHLSIGQVPFDLDVRRKRTAHNHNC